MNSVSENGNGPPPRGPGERPDEGQKEPDQARSTASTRIRVLVAEDEFLVWLLLEEELLALGYTIIGPFASVSTATDAARRESFDFAILDVNLSGTLVFPLADELSSRDIPFMFVSGYGSIALPEKHRGVPRLAKPYQRANLVEAIDRLVLPGRRANSVIKYSSVNEAVDGQVDMSATKTDQES